jgi:hypothetical protein
MQIIASLIARIVLGAKRNLAILKNSKQRFWDARPWSRLINWGQHFKNAVDYLRLNKIEVNFDLKRFSAREILRKIKVAENDSQLIVTGFV